MRSTCLCRRYAIVADVFHSCCGARSPIRLSSRNHHRHRRHPPGAAQVAKVVQKELERRKRLGSPAAAAGSSGGSAFGSLEGLLQLLVGRVLQKEADQRAVRDAVGKAVGGAEAKRLFGDAAA